MTYCTQDRSGLKVQTRQKEQVSLAPAVQCFILDLHFFSGIYLWDSGLQLFITSCLCTLAVAQLQIKCTSLPLDVELRHVTRSGQGHVDRSDDVPVSSLCCHHEKKTARPALWSQEEDEKQSRAAPAPSQT